MKSEFQSAGLAFFAASFSLPLVLLLSYSLFLYLVTIYWHRRRNAWVIVLFATAAISFVILIPFARVPEHLLPALNDVSETCNQMTFLVQLIVLGRDSKQSELRSVRVFTLTGQVLVLAESVVLVLSTHDLSGVHHAAIVNDVVHPVCENLTLVFICVCRFHYLAITTGTSELWRTKKVELILYALFVTHNVPFYIIELQTGVSWDLIQALYYRLTMTLCVAVSIQNKLRRIHERRRSALAQRHYSPLHQSRNSKPIVISASQRMLVAKPSTRETVTVTTHEPAPTSQQ